MGKQTKTFRQSKKSGSADTSAKNFARINRSTGWNIFKIFRKGDKSWQG